MKSSIQLTITPEDLALAQKEKLTRASMCCCCLVFQAAKRVGLEPVNCAISVLSTKTNDYQINTDGRKITLSKSVDWPTHVGKSFTLTQIGV